MRVAIAKDANGFMLDGKIVFGGRTYDIADNEKNRKIIQCYKEWCQIIENHPQIEMVQCKGIRRDGERCSQQVPISSGGYCGYHKNQAEGIERT